MECRPAAMQVPREGFDLEAHTGPPNVATRKSFPSLVRFVWNVARTRVGKTKNGSLEMVQIRSIIRLAIRISRCLELLM